MLKETPAILQKTDDICFGFALENAPVRGQIVSLGPATADEILSRHNLPYEVSVLLGELLVVATMSGSSLKFDGKLIVEIRNENGRDDLPIQFLVAEYNARGTLRAMAKINHEKLNLLLQENKSPNLKDFFGEGIMLFTLDQSNINERYQGQVALIGDNISQVAEHYFKNSEQLPTKIMIACDNDGGSKSHQEWRVCGIIIQQVAGDDARGDTKDIWAEAGFKFDTLKREELLDKELSAGELLLRLYHENNVYSFEPILLHAKCNCSYDRLVNIIRGFSKDDISHMIESDGFIHAKCEFCNIDYEIRPQEL